MRRLRYLGVLLLTALGACADLATGVPFLSRHAAGEEGALRAESTSSALRLTNTGGTTIYYNVIDGAIAPLILWGPCSDPKRCPRVEPGSRVDLRWSDVDGYDPGREQTFFVYWWYLVRDGRGFAHDSLRMVPVRP